MNVEEREGEAARNSPEEELVPNDNNATISQPDPSSSVGHSWMGPDMTFAEVQGLRRITCNIKTFFRTCFGAKSRMVLAARIGGSLAEEIPVWTLPSLDVSYASLPTVLKGLRLAAHDPCVAHLHVRVDMVQCGWGKALEIRRHLEYFSQSGKPMTVYMERGTEKEYFMTCGLRNCQVFLPPEGDLVLRGFRAHGMFVRGLLENIGVEPQVERIGKFKFAGDQLNRKDMSMEQKHVLENLISQVQEMWVQCVAKSKNMSENDVLGLVDRGMHATAEYAAAGLISGVKYEEDIFDDIGTAFSSRKTKAKSDKQSISSPLRIVKLSKYVKKTTEKQLSIEGDKKIGIIRTAGTITSGKNGRQPLVGKTVGSETFLKELEKAGKDKSIKAVVIRIDSPGGAALASDVMYNGVLRLAQKKPVIASMADLGASGGYYIAMAANYIVAESMTLTGSIGVVSASMSLEELYRKIGLGKETVSRGRYAEVGIETRRFTRDEAEYFRRSAERMYESFVRKAAERRGMTLESMEEVAQGRVWSGREAVTRGLIDELGGFWHAVNIGKQKAGIAETDYVKIVDVHGKVSLLARLGFGSSARIARSLLDNRVGTDKCPLWTTGGEPLLLCEEGEVLSGPSNLFGGMSLLDKVIGAFLIDSAAEAGCLPNL